MLENDSVALHVLNQQSDGVIARSDAALVGVREIADKTVVVEFEVVVFEVLLKDNVGTVWCVHDEVDLLNVVPAKGVPDLDGKLHFSERWTMVGRPFEFLGIVPVATVRFVAAVNPHA